MLLIVVDIELYMDFFGKKKEAFQHVKDKHDMMPAPIGGKERTS